MSFTGKSSDYAEKTVSSSFPSLSGNMKKILTMLIQQAYNQGQHSAILDLNAKTREFAKNIANEIISQYPTIVRSESVNFISLLLEEAYIQALVDADYDVETTLIEIKTELVNF